MRSVRPSSETPSLCPSPYPLLSRDQELRPAGAVHQLPDHKASANQLGYGHPQGEGLAWATSRYLDLPHEAAIERQARRPTKKGKLAVVLKLGLEISRRPILCHNGMAERDSLEAGQIEGCCETGLLDKRFLELDRGLRIGHCGVIPFTAKELVKVKFLLGSSAFDPVAYDVVVVAPVVAPVVVAPVVVAPVVVAPVVVAHAVVAPAAASVASSSSPCSAAPEGYRSPA
ncbi:hypothetical protein HG530_000768 [Fusarium avenaceum]|nr:hypothetical protein HG530_000768 [Fusarium avenaceum]